MDQPDVRPPTARSWELARAVLFVATFAICCRALVRFSRRVSSDQLLSPYLSPTYWLDYDEGFLRRALTGELVRWLSGGGDVSYAGAGSWAAVFTGAAVLSLLVLAAVLARCAPGDAGDRLAVAAVVLASPLGLSVPVVDFGRPDAFGLVVLVILAVVPWRRVPRPIVIVAVMALTSVAVGAEEFLLLVVAPVGVYVVWRRLQGTGWTGAWAAVSLGPAVALALASALVPTPVRTVGSAVAEAVAAGAPAPDPLVVDGRVLIEQNSSVVPLDSGLVENIRDYYAQMSVSAVIVMTAVWCAVFLVTIGLVWRLLGGSVRDRWFLAVASAGVVVALVLSVVAVDYRRWWALAAVGALAVFVVRGPWSPRQGRGPAMASAAVFLAVAGVVLQVFDVLVADLSWDLVTSPLRVLGALF